MSRAQVRVSVEVPEVEECPASTLVRCGDTTVQVAEHGRTGNGKWAVWQSGCVVHSLGNGNEERPYEEVLARARTYVELVERRRLVQAAVFDTFQREGGDLL